MIGVEKVEEKATTRRQHGTFSTRKPAIPCHVASDSRNEDAFSVHCRTIVTSGSLYHLPLHLRIYIPRKLSFRLRELDFSWVVCLFGMRAMMA